MDLGQSTFLLIQLCRRLLHLSLFFQFSGIVWYHQLSILSKRKRLSHWQKEAV